MADSRFAVSGDDELPDDELREEEGTSASRLHFLIHRNG